MTTKYRLVSLTGTLLLLCALLFSCGKGEVIEGVGYGLLNLSGTISTGGVLVVRIDEQVADTLTQERPGTLSGLTVKEGSHQLRFSDLDNKVLLDTVINIDAGKTYEVPKFYYNGSAVLFDDYTAAPEKDSALVRIIILDPTLPDVLDLVITVYDFGDVRIPVKTIKGVTKTGFSDFIQLPEPLSYVPPGTGFGFAYYVIEGYDPNDGDRKVFSIEQGNYYFLTFEGFTSFVPNAVLSLGLGKDQNGSPANVTIFQHIN